MDVLNEVSYAAKNRGPDKLNRDKRAPARRWGGRWDSNPRSSGPQAYADGYSTVSAGLSKYFFAPIFRGFEQICRVMPLQKKLSNCRKSVGKILQTITVDTSFFTGCNTGCNKRKEVIRKYTQIGYFTLNLDDAKEYLYAKSTKRRIISWRDIHVNVFI